MGIAAYSSMSRRASKQHFQHRTVSGQLARASPPDRMSQCSSRGGDEAADESLSPAADAGEADLCSCSSAMSRAKEDISLPGGSCPAVYHSGTSTYTVSPKSSKGNDP